MMYSFDHSGPHANRPEAADHLIHFDSGLTEQEIATIREIGDTLATTPVTLFSGGHDPSRVRASGSHFMLTDETRWVYERMATVAKELNESSYQFDLNGFDENFYYLSYGEGDHFGWHIDTGYQTNAPRKLSLVLQLSSPKEYEGGDFDVLIAHDHARALRQKGTVIGFPSYKVHRVTPVTSGQRRTLTMFVTGPMFR